VNWNETIVVIDENGDMTETDEDRRIVELLRSMGAVTNGHSIVVRNCAMGVAATVDGGEGER